MSRARAIGILAAALPLLLAGCVTARLHSEAELAGVGRDCGVALGELFQDQSEKRLLFLFKPGATPGQRACVTRWARRNHLKTVIVDAIDFPES